MLEISCNTNEMDLTGEIERKENGKITFFPNVFLT
jgi:hypothetical protein